MAIEHFGAEFLIHPAPLEYSAYKYSHSCAYCFANIRNKDRDPEISLVIKQLTGKSESKSLANQLIKLGYPICISNRTDPFSKNNVRTTLSLCEYLEQRPNGVFFQTRGFEGVKDAIKILGKKKNVVLYVSITSTNNDILKKVEPGAPTIEKRIETMLAGKEAGWSVICAVNPCSEYFMPENDLIRLEDKLFSSGIKHFIFQKLRLNKADLKSMSKWKIEALGKDVIEKALGYDRYFADQVIRQREKGLLALAYGMPFSTNFFDEINTKLGKYFNSNYAFYNFVQSSKKEKFTFDDYFKSIIGVNTELLNIRSKDFSKVIMCQNRGVWKNNEYVQNTISIKEVLYTIWNDRRMSASPQNNQMMSLCSEKDYEGNLILKRKEPEK